MLVYKNIDFIILLNIRKTDILLPYIVIIIP